MLVSAVFIAPRRDVDAIAEGSSTLDGDRLAAYIREKTADYDVCNAEHFQRQDITKRVYSAWRKRLGEHRSWVGMGALADKYDTMDDLAADVWGAHREMAEDEGGSYPRYYCETVPYPTYDHVIAGGPGSFAFPDHLRALSLEEYLKRFDAQRAGTLKPDPRDGDDGSGGLFPTYDTGAIADADRGMMVDFISYEHFDRIERAVAKELLPSLQQPFWERLREFEKARAYKEYVLDRELFLLPYRADPIDYVAVAFSFNSARMATKSGRHMR